MKRTSPGFIVGSWLIATTVGLVANFTLVGSGQLAWLPPFTFGISQAVLGAAVLAIAWPVRSAAQGKRRIDFRYAVFVLSIAKAGSIVGSLVGGYTLGAFVFVLTRPVTPGEVVVQLALTALGGAALMVCSIVAEGWCKLPPDEDERASLGFQ